MIINEKNKPALKKTKDGVVLDNMKLTQEQYQKIIRADNVVKMNQFLKGMGLIFVILVYFLMADFLFEITFFGLIFENSRDEFNHFWAYISSELRQYSDVMVEGLPLASGNIFDDWFEWGNLLPKLAMTIFLVLLTVGIAYLIAFTINDIIGMIKNLLKNSKKTIIDIGQTAIQGIANEIDDETYDVLHNRKNRKLFDDDNVLDSGKEAMKKKAKKPVKVKKSKEESVDDEVDALLNQLLSHPHTDEEETIVNNINNNQGRVDE